VYLCPISVFHKPGHPVLKCIMPLSFSEHNSVYVTLIKSLNCMGTLIHFTFSWFISRRSIWPYYFRYSKLRLPHCFYTDYLCIPNILYLTYISIGLNIVTCQLPTLLKANRRIFQDSIFLDLLHRIEGFFLYLLLLYHQSYYRL